MRMTIGNGDDNDNGDDDDNSDDDDNGDDNDNGDDDNDGDDGDNGDGGEHKMHIGSKRHQYLRSNLMMMRSWQDQRNANLNI